MKLLCNSEMKNCKRNSQTITRAATVQHHIGITVAFAHMLHGLCRTWYAAFPHCVSKAPLKLLTFEVVNFEPRL